MMPLEGKHLKRSVCGIGEDYMVYIQDDMGFVYPIEEIEIIHHEKTIILKAEQRRLK